MSNDIQTAAENVKHFSARIGAAFADLAKVGPVLEQLGSLAQAEGELQKRITELQAQVCSHEEAARKRIAAADEEARKRIADADKRSAEIIEAANKERRDAEAMKAEAAEARRQRDAARSEHAELVAKIATAKAQLRALLEG